VVFPGRAPRNEEDKTKDMKANPRKLLLALAGLVSILLIGEILAGRLFPQKTLQAVEKMSLRCYRASDYLPYEYEPGCGDDMAVGNSWTKVAINELGLRGKSVGEKIKKRILLVGDSFVFGYGVSEDERIGDVLESGLENVEVISAGFVGDAGPDTLYLYTKKEGLTLKPDLILLFLFPYNDLSDIEKTVWTVRDNEIQSAKMPDRMVSNGYLRRSDTSLKYRIPLLGDSHLFQLIFDRIDILTVKLRRKVFLRLGLIQTAVEDHEKFRDCLYREICGDKWDEAKFKTERIFQLFKQLSDQQQVPVLAVTIPLEGQVFGSEQAETLFQQLLRREEIKFLDLIPAFRDSGQSGSDLFLPDGHWTAAGHEVAAKAAADWLQTLQLPQNDER